MKKLHERIADALSGKKSSTEVRAVHAEVQHRITELEQYIKQIDENPAPGPERLKLLSSGSPEDLVEMNADLALAKAELKQLFHQRTDLHHTIGIQLAKESVNEAPKLRENLNATVKKAQSAYRAFLAARDEAEAIAKAIASGREACRQCGMDENDVQADQDAADWLSMSLEPGRDSSGREKRYHFLKTILPNKIAMKITGGQENRYFGPAKSTSPSTVRRGHFRAA